MWFFIIKINKKFKAHVCKFIDFVKRDITKHKNNITRFIMEFSFVKFLFLFFWFKFYFFVWLWLDYCLHLFPFYFLFSLTAQHKKMLNFSDNHIIWRKFRHFLKLFIHSHGDEVLFGVSFWHNYFDWTVAQ